MFPLCFRLLSLLHEDHFEFLIATPLTKSDIDYLNISTDTTSQKSLMKTIKQINRTLPNPVAASRILNIGGIWFSIGMRCVYLSFPPIMWMFGDWVFFAAGMVLVPIMFFLDFRSGLLVGRRGRGGMDGEKVSVA